MLQTGNEIGTTVPVVILGFLTLLVNSIFSERRQNKRRKWTQEDRDKEIAEQKLKQEAQHKENNDALKKIMAETEKTRLETEKIAAETLRLREERELIAKKLQEKEKLDSLRATELLKATKEQTKVLLESNLEIKTEIENKIDSISTTPLN